MTTVKVATRKAFQPLTFQGKKDLKQISGVPAQWRDTSSLAGGRERLWFRPPHKVGRLENKEGEKGEEGEGRHPSDSIF